MIKITEKDQEVCIETSNIKITICKNGSVVVN